MSSTDERVSPASRTLVIGEALIDIVERDGSATEHVGGSPANVALTLARLGRPATLVTDIADDERGRRISAHLEASGVEVRHGDSERTSTARAVLAADGSARYVFDLSWNPPAADPEGASHVHTGSIAIFLEPGGSAVLELLEALPAGVTASVDANIRPALVGAHAEALARFERIAAACEVVKLSDEDAEWLYPTMQLDEVLSRLLSLGSQLAVVTRGAEGLLLASAMTRVTVPAARIVVADTIGAGDSAMGAILDEAFRQGLGAANGMLLDGPALHAIGRHAAHVAGITTSRSGANPPTRDEL
ncbi:MULTISPECIES: carbohydrate kinase [unclassified Rathayibacter]|uniref:carbohydrate kinase family protein n=1 Tax=unclassified Rathayibacter TaxID=2609250 RepID=UPI000CE83155|nr:MULTISPECIES: carbohydrate kinase [unclassified Rathayibacter]PPH03755.1 carbohydrate kinase [Rathayibacter sp. AY1F6]PPH38702.1 carbohydrate kinase [Rathayibacter sp. AY1E3]PPH92562.1 carbohydrate kinase [Rathayibacter sp. AY1D5]PPI07397.1 carbohydrate kinase [Rathayibacter sp. AY1B8]